MPNPTEDLAQSGEEEVTGLLSDPAFLFRWKKELDRFIIGEDENKLLLTLICASSYTSFNLSAVINGSSSAGKSWLKGKVLRYFQNVESYTRITRAAPDRLGQDFTKKILDVEELRGSEAAQSTLRVWISEGNLKLLTTERNEEGKLDTTVIETKGSPTFITTCTNAEIDDELLNRVFIVSIDETREQTKKIIRYEGETCSKLGDQEEEDKPNPLFASALAKLTYVDRVVIPYAVCLADKFPIPKGAELSVGPRRDFKKLLYLIGVVAWFHQKQRLIVAPSPLNEKTAKALGKQFVVASPIDFYMVWRICRKGFLATLFKLSERHKNILETFHAGANKTVRDVAEEVNLSENRTREFLNSLVKKGYLSLDRSQKTYTYSLKQKNELEGTIEDFVASLNSFQETELHIWLEAHNYKILLTPLTPPSFINPLSGEVEESAKRILSYTKSEPKLDTKTETEPPDSMKSPIEPPTSVMTVKARHVLPGGPCQACNTLAVEWELLDENGTMRICTSCFDKLRKNGEVFKFLQDDETS